MPAPQRNAGIDDGEITGSISGIILLVCRQACRASPHVTNPLSIRNGNTRPDIIRLMERSALTGLSPKLRTAASGRHYLRRWSLMPTRAVMRND